VCGRQPMIVHVDGISNTLHSVNRPLTDPCRFEFIDDMIRKRQGFVDTAARLRTSTILSAHKPASSTIPSCHERMARIMKALDAA